MARNLSLAGLLATALLLVACGGGGGGLTSPTPTAPSALTYPSPQVYTANTAIATLSPSVTGTVTSYSVSPALPAGLTLSTTTGQISGTPTAAAAQATYVVTASNVVGSTTFNLVITVNGTGTMGGTVTGLNGTGLKLSNGTAEVTINANGAFTFPGNYASGINYHVTVTQAPASPAQTCAIVNGIGTTTTVATTSINVVCANTPAAGRFVYVANNGGSNISAWQVNPTTGALSAVVGGPFPSGSALTQLVAHPNGKFLYGRSLSDNNIRAFAINQAATPMGGALTEVAGSPFVAGPDAGPAYIDPSGKWLIVPNVTAPSLSVYSIDGNTGVLTPVTGSPFALNYNPGGVIFRPDGKFVYVADMPGNEMFGYAVNATTGALTALSTPFFTSGNSVAEMAIDPQGRFFYGSTVQGTMYVATIDNTTGALVPAGVGNTPVGNLPRTPFIDATGRFLYVSLGMLGDPGRIAPFTINQTSGVISTTGPSPTVSTGTGSLRPLLALRPDGRFLYGTTALTDLMYAFEIDSTDGELVSIPGHPFAVQSGPNAPVVDPAGRFVYVSSSVNNNLSVYSSDLATGALTPVPGSPYPAGASPIGVVVVP